LGWLGIVDGDDETISNYQIKKQWSPIINYDKLNILSWGTIGIIKYWDLYAETTIARTTVVEWTTDHLEPLVELDSVSDRFSD